jgi:putative peptidoglycan lipid II flippase
LLREVTLAATFGAGAVSDAFVICMTLPTVVLVLFTSSVSTLFIPQYARIENDKNRFTNSVITLLALIGLLFSVAFTIFPQALIYVFASNLSPETFGIAAALFRVMVWSSAPILLIAVFRSYLQIHRVFFIATVLDSCVNVFIILAMIAGKATGIVSVLGAGAVAGNCLSLFMFYILSRHKGLRYKPVLDISDPDIRMMMKLMLPIILSMSVREINTIIDRNLASGLASGSISALNYAFKINNVATALLGTAIGTAMFPQISEYGAKGDMESLKSTVMSVFNTLVPIIIPLTVGMIALAKPITRILLERGAFSAANTAMTAECLIMYSVCLAPGNLVPIILRAFYAMQKPKIPTIISSIALIIGIILDLILIRFMQHSGLALATSISSIVNLALLLAVFRHTVGKLGLRKQLADYIKVCCASVVMCIVVLVLMNVTPITSGTYSQTFVWTLVIVGCALITYAVLLVVVRASIIKRIANIHRHNASS